MPLGTDGGAGDFPRLTGDPAIACAVARSELNEVREAWASGGSATYSQKHDNRSQIRSWSVAWGTRMSQQDALTSVCQDYVSLAACIYSVMGLLSSRFPRQGSSDLPLATYLPGYSPQQLKSPQKVVRCHAEVPSSP